MSKKALEKAMKEKDDEYYTRYEDVENELNHYKDYFKDKECIVNGKPRFTIVIIRRIK